MFISFIEQNMCKVHQLIFILCLLFTLINSVKIFSCISNTSCKCILTEHSFILINCSYSLPDLPIFNSNTSINITKIFARNALIRWPKNLCKYLNIRILDLSGSYFHSQSIDLSCLYHLIHLNLSNTHLTELPNLEKNLQILDLSNNQIEILDGNYFRLLNNLIKLYLQNNPFKQINHLEYLLSLSHLQFINLISIKSVIPIKKPLTVNQWIYLANKWNNTNKSLIIRTNTIPLQSIFPNSKQFQLISLDLMKIIFKTLSNSTFTTLVFTPKCNCIDLQNYQRIFSFKNTYENLFPLFQTSTCLMSNGIIHVGLFDRRTFTDLHCLSLEKRIQNSCSLLDYHLFILFFIFYLFYRK